MCRLLCTDVPVKKKMDRILVKELTEQPWNLTTKLLTEKMGWKFTSENVSRKAHGKASVNDVIVKLSNPLRGSLIAKYSRNKKKEAIKGALRVLVNKALEQDYIEQTYDPNGDLYVQLTARSDRCIPLALSDQAKKSATVWDRSLRGVQKLSLSKEHTQRDRGSPPQWTSPGSSSGNAPSREKVPHALQKFRADLPMHGHRSAILGALKTDKILLLEGETGCGKSTQVPQYLLEEAEQTNQPCRIVVTQPRRVAAIALARRVAKELGQEMGQQVGYKVCW
jgi:hypothetical protein